MANTEIKLSSVSPYFKFEKYLEGEKYTFTFKWNERMEQWFVNINDTVEDVVFGKPIVKDVEMLVTELDSGYVKIIGQNEIPTYESLGTIDKIYYVSE